MRFKRFFDFMVSLVLLIALSPILLALSLAVALGLGRPVFFCQDRPGKDGRIFKMVKFRSMTNQRDERGEPLPDGDRLTPFGRWLRSTSLDELPELWNVVRGEMSLVGPRPLLVRYLDRYSPEQARRLEVRPGITGWAQIHGRNAQTWEERFRYDVWYVDHRSFALDLRILFLTLGKVIGREGISSNSCETMEEFRGGKW